MIEFIILAGIIISLSGILIHFDQLVYIFSSPFKQFTFYNLWNDDWIHYGEFCLFEFKITVNEKLLIKTISLTVWNYLIEFDGNY